MSNDGKNTSFMPDKSPGTWKEGTIEGETKESRDPLLGPRFTADVRDPGGELHKDVTITKPDKD